MAIRAVLFDLDDTLLDGVGTNAERAARVAARIVRAHPELDPVELVSRLRNFSPVNGWTVRTNALLRELGLEGSPCAEEATGLTFYQGCFDLVRPFDGAIETIAELAERLVLGVITNGRDLIQRSKFEHLPFAGSFSVFMSSERAGCSKPAIEIFQQTLLEAGVAAHEAVFIGDRLDTDVLGARDAGLRTVWFSHIDYPVLPEHPTPDAIIRTFAELPGAIRKFES